MLLARSIKADIRRENYKVNFKIGTAIPLFGRNEMKLGTEDRRDGEERKTVETARNGKLWEKAKST